MQDRFGPVSKTPMNSNSGLGPVSKISKNSDPPHRINSLANTTTVQGGTPDYRIETADNFDIDSRILTRHLPLASPRSYLSLSKALICIVFVVASLLATFVSPAYAAFGVVPGSFSAGTASLQAGAHADLTTSFAFNTHSGPNPVFLPLLPDENAKNIIVKLPPGVSGNPLAYPQCSAAYAAAQRTCPADTQVGTIAYALAGPPVLANIHTRVYNMVPQNGSPAEFGFINPIGASIQVHILASVRTGDDYGLTGTVPEVPGNLRLLHSSLTLWGVPADSSHDGERGQCLGLTGPTGDTCPSDLPARPFLSNSTECTASGVTTLTADSWEHPNVFFTPLLSVPQTLTGCDKLVFEPSLTLQPQSRAEDVPSAYTVSLHVPQTDSPAALATAHLRKAVVTLPEGVTVSPSAADGLKGCSDAEIAIHSAAEQTCPDGAKIGSVTVDTGILPAPLQGAVYQGTQVPGHLLRIFIVAKGFGVLIKQPGSVDLDPVTGRITTTVDSAPQQPFKDFVLNFKGGPRAPLSNPRTCGTKTTTAKLTSWGGQVVTTSDSFVISREGNGGPCPPPQFKPTLNAGTTSPIAGGFSPFDLQLQRTDDDQEFQSLRSLSLPPGLLADVGSVSTRCTEIQARAAACPVASHIGTVMTGAGAGPDPFYVPGDVYLMGGFGGGPFKGDPFGLAVVVHALAGPFDLGYVVVETGIRVHDDGSISAQTEPFPSILQGIPLQLKDIRLSLDRPNFILNPTNCSQMAVAGSVVSTEGMVAPVSSRFQVGECAALGFKPSFTVSTAGKTSKANGASLHVHLATHQGPTSAGAPGESNIAKVDVQLPVVLPARLPTLQKACTAAQFGADPAGCPVGSFVGTAIAHTPILASPLSGPAILVSHGGEAFPDLVLVLQGEGVRINLTGHTQIKKGITFNHFETVPDAPVSSFDLTLPAGPHGVLTTDIPGRNLCATTRTVTVTKRVMRRVHGHNRRVTVKAKKAVAAPLLMPTTMTAQNGAVIHQNTKIAVTGCAAVKTKAKKAKAGKSTRR